MSQTKSNRRSFIDLAEAVRTLNVDKVAKEKIVSNVGAVMIDEAAFSLPHFAAHALSDLDGEDGKWAYNKAACAGPGSGAYEAYGDDVDDEDESDESGQN
jgi:hypothetical protein